MYMLPLPSDPQYLIPAPVCNPVERVPRHGFGLDIVGVADKP